MPTERTLTQLRNHFEVEKELAAQLRASTRAQRKEMYARLYAELFERVPDHSRLLQREDAAKSLKRNQNKASLLNGLLHKDVVFAEIAPGDCKFSFYVADKVKKVYGIDISDQSNQDEARPDNFEMQVFDGYSIDMSANSVDVLFSDQLIEHIHPDDVDIHFEIAKKILKPGGVYFFRIPHRLSGPHDISRYFSDKAEGFHLNEPLFTEIAAIVKRLGFSSYRCYWTAKGKKIQLPFFYYQVLEGILGQIPYKIRKKPARYLLHPVVMAVYK